MQMFQAAVGKTTHRSCFGGIIDLKINPRFVSHTSFAASGARVAFPASSDETTAPE